MKNTTLKKNKMKNQQLKNLIKEEIKNLLKEEEVKGKKPNQEVIALKKYLEGTGKDALSRINSPGELKDVLNIIWSGMNESFQKTPVSIALQKIIDSKL